jgi:regulator of replication initiation timing
MRERVSPVGAARDANRRCPRPGGPDGLGDMDTAEKGESIMTGVGVGAEREQIIRWMEEGRNILEIIVRLLNDADQLKVAAEATQKENERLRYECDQLRREVNQLTADRERSQKERAEIAQWFSSVMSEAASRLLIERPPA